MNQAMISACILMMAFGTGCRISLDPIGGGGGAGATGSAGATDSAGATGGAGATDSAGATGGAGATGSAGAAGGNMVFPRAAVPVWSKAVPDAEITEWWPHIPDVVADGMGNTVLFPHVGWMPIDSFDSNGDHRWSNTFGGDSTPTDVAVNRSGLVAIAGTTKVGLDLGGGRLDVPEGGYYHTVAGVFNAAGEHIWSKVFSGGPQTITVGGHVALDAHGNMTLLGIFDSAVTFGDVVLRVPQDDIRTTYFLARLDPTGRPLWAKSYSWHASISYMNTDASGNIVIAGRLAGQADFGGGERVSSCSGKACNEIFVVKYDAAGAYLWDRTFRSARWHVNGVAMDGSGNVALTGTFWDDLDLGAVRLQSRGGPEHVTEFDEPGPFPAPGGDIFVMKLAPEGDLLWARSFGDDKSQAATSIAMTEGGDIALTGNITGRLEIGADTVDCALPHAFVTKLDSAGNPRWIAHSCASLVDDNRVGVFAHSRTGTSVTTDGSDNVIATGPFAGTIDFGAGPLTQPDADKPLHGFLVKFAP
ncbi:hypothetical protein WME91_38740 [Sorangium sp. So ce269]